MDDRAHGVDLMTRRARPGPPGTRRDEANSVLDTTEIRWFVPGPLPADIAGWFRGSTGVSEERYDTYLLGGRRDTGVKRRFRQTLEVKVRQSLEERVELGDGLTGPLEVWRKWSPADDPDDDVIDGPWVDVHKSIVKRRFSIDGTENVFSSDLPAAGPGCDVEVAGVTVGAVRAWTFAFAAFGSPATRRDALLAAWSALVAAPFPATFGPRDSRAMGYPEWLALTVSPGSAGSRRGDDPAVWCG